METQDADTVEITMILPMPPSSNNLYSFSKKHNKRFKVRDHEFFRTIDKEMLRHTKEISEFRKFVSKMYPLIVTREFVFSYSQLFSKHGTLKRLDLTNRVKAIDDAVTEALFVDDSQIFEDRSLKLFLDPNSQEMPFVRYTMQVVMKDARSLYEMSFEEEEEPKEESSAH